MSKIFMIGNAHVDPAWMWRIEEGMESFIATCRSALDRIAETPDFVFTCSSAAHYEYLRNTDHGLFRRIQDAVTHGRWSIVGGWWVEGDCNLPHGESFVRQALYGQKFFREHFGKTTTVGYCIDSFGHNANLPQLLHGAGLESYLFMRPEEHEKHLDHYLFNWQSPSGESVTAYRIPLHYSNHALSSKEKISALRQFADFGAHPWMLFFGVGNHGGGPTKAEIRQILDERLRDDSITFGDPESFFQSIANGENFQTYQGELQPHAIGCYSAHSEIKRLNRKAEHLLLVAERITGIAESLVGHVTSGNIFDLAWQNVLFNQFHDILGGVAILEAMDDAISMYRESISIAERETKLAIQSIASNIDTHENIETLLLFNPSAFDRTELVEFELWHPEASEKNSPLRSLRLSDGSATSFPVQQAESSGKIGGDRVRFMTRVTIPAFGYSGLKLERNVKSLDTHSTIDVSESELSNGKVGVSFAEVTKPTREFVHRAHPEVFNDQSDTWGHGLLGFTQSLSAFDVVERVVRETGPLRGCVRIKSIYGLSSMIEDWKVSKGSNEVDVDVRLRWLEERKALKFRIPHGIADPIATYEIPYSVIERPIGTEEYPGQSWIFVSSASGEKGIGLITDCKYSYSVDANFINVLVARSPLYAHHSPPHDPSPSGDHRHLDIGEQEFRLRIVLGFDSYQSAEMPRRAEQFLEPMIVHVESGHAGKLPIRSAEISEISASNIQLTVLKMQDEGSGIIVRLMETSGIETKETVRLGVFGVEWDAYFSPYQLKTFLIERSSEGQSQVRDVNFLEA